MVSKNLYLNIIFYVILLTITSWAASYFYFEQNNNVISILLLNAVVIEIIILVQYLNKTNRRLAYFVDSIRNADTSVKFPKDIKNKPVHDLYNSLNHLNKVIQKIKMESSYNENLLKTLIEYSSTGFITMDEKGNFEVMNNYARRFLNVEYTSNLKRLSHSDPKLYQIINHIKPGETKVYKLQTEKQVYDLSVSLSEIKYFDHSFKIISMQDISNQLDEHELEAWHKLFRVITHEIMNSIAPITSLSQTLGSFYKKDGETKPVDDINEKIVSDTVTGLKVINEMSSGLMGFVDAYRKLSKLPKPELKKVDSHQWLSGFKALALEQIKDCSIELNITLTNDCKTIEIDQQLMSQVLLNLLQNAVDALQDGKEKKIDLHVRREDNNKTTITFSDTGKGISEENLERIFVPFFTTKDSGNGIGLSLSKQIVKQHGGSMLVHSQVDKGTTFVIQLNSY